MSSAFSNDALTVIIGSKKKTTQRRKIHTHTLKHIFDREKRSPKEEEKKKKEKNELVVCDRFCRVIELCVLMMMMAKNEKKRKKI